MRRVFYYLARPYLVVVAIVKRMKLGSFPFRSDIDAVQYPHYAFGTLHAAQLAKTLKIPAISVIEFGIAKGNGLITLDAIAREVSQKTGVTIKVFGFDTGVGMPHPEDYKDLPFVWQQGIYAMDEAYIKSQLHGAEMVLGNTKITVPKFLDRNDVPPIGFIAFDLDYYSSTRDAFALFKGSDSLFLPRVLTYFDDLISANQTWISEFAGEFLAIKEFNEANATQKISPLYGLGLFRTIPAPWNHAMYCLHRFHHRQYATPVA